MKNNLNGLYEAKFPKSKELWLRQSKVTPGGFTHALRGFSPFPLFIKSNRGAAKWDVDGNKFIDYWMGHGAMLLGHANPVINDAIRAVLEDGLHAGGETELGLEWGKLIQELVPSAEKVRFMSSGGEATQMAIRVARAYTGKEKFIKFQSSFHGWHDAVCAAVNPPYEIPFSPGIPKATLESVITLPLNDVNAVNAALEKHKDIGAIIVEPGGGFNDSLPSDPEFLKFLRKRTAELKIVLIFDEVVTGFRYAKGGAQAYFGITPDLSSLGKVVAGGLPAGALVGKDEIMQVMASRPDAKWVRNHMVPHPGTWNAMPVLAAAGVAAMKLIKETDAVEKAKSLTASFIKQYNSLCEKNEFASFAYGRSSIFKIRVGKRPKLIAGDFSNFAAEGPALIEGWGAAGPEVRKAMLLEGVDLMRTDGFFSTEHTEQDIQMTLRAFEKVLPRWRAGEFG